MSSIPSVWDNNYAAGIVSSWTSHPLVAEHVYRRITGGVPSFWMNWMFEVLLQNRRYKNLLSIGCGDGAHELLIGRGNYANKVDAFDGSSVGIEVATAAAKKEKLSCEFWVDRFEDFAARKNSKRYDFILFSGSLHHVRDLEAMLAKVHELLTDDGVVCVNEYVGPRHGMYPPHQVKAVNDVLSAISPEFKRSPDVRMQIPTIQQVKDYDPSEGIRSSLIPPYLDIFFEPIYETRFGGFLLHPLFDCLNSEKLKDRSPESDSLVRVLIELDNVYSASPQHGSDFMFGVFKKKDIV